MSNERLDDETEKVFAGLIEAGLSHGYTTKLAIADCRPCQEALTAARTRINELRIEYCREGRISVGNYDHV